MKNYDVCYLSVVLSQQDLHIPDNCERQLVCSASNVTTHIFFFIAFSDGCFNYTIYAEWLDLIFFDCPQKNLHFTEKNNKVLKTFYCKMSVEGDVMRIQKKLSKMSSSDGEVSEKLTRRHFYRRLFLSSSNIIALKAGTGVCYAVLHVRKIV